jgi:hypothetical protein
MSIISRLASAQGRNDEAPNILLAQQIAEHANVEGVAELVDLLWHEDKAIQSDAIKVLYEVAEIVPDLVTPHYEHFISLLGSDNNRMVWGAMTAIGLMAPQIPDQIWAHVETIKEVTLTGSAITQDWGIRTLAALSAANGEYEMWIFPFLIEFLEDCADKDLVRHAESITAATNAVNAAIVMDTLDGRMGGLKESQAKRVQKIIRKLESM